MVALAQSLGVQISKLEMVALAQSLGVQISKLEMVALAQSLGVQLKYTEPPERALPVQRWRLYELDAGT
ncbi:hypothetical protein T484DRAFT_1800423 [Baffinella frigidus]|nr:hypothetical protein T484DRAFT_1800423 [Cryptophyta sp. CCMP2293]